MTKSPGKKLRLALAAENPLQIVGVFNAYIAMMAEKTGYQALYLSGAGIANFCYGLPDLGLTTLEQVAQETRRIASASALPLVVDIDTGWGSPSAVERAVKEISHAKAAAVHIEDQVQNKRCGHRSGKTLISKQEMEDKVSAAIQAKEDADFMVIARTDAIEPEGLEKAVERAVAYEKAGADAIFAEAVHSIEECRAFSEALTIPLLINQTEFGATPLFSLEAMRQAGVSMVLYPLSAARCANLAALEALSTIRNKGSQATLIDQMQTREELYHFLNYFNFEKQSEQR